MKMNHNQVLKQLEQLKERIGLIKEDADYSDHYEYISGGNIDFSDDAEGRFLKEHMKNILTELSDIEEKISHITNEIVAEGIAMKNVDNRYEISSTVLSCGKRVEALINIEGIQKWVQTRIEHNGDYYMAGYSDVPLEGTYIRIRKK